jgi:hypothetical protein
MSNIKFIVVTGTVLDGLDFHGVFDTYAEAEAWATVNFEQTSFLVTSLLNVKGNKNV